LHKNYFFLQTKNLLMNLAYFKKKVLRLITNLKARLIQTQLVVIPHDAGFFSNFNKILNHLVVSTIRHKAIVVDWRITKEMSNTKLQFSFYGRPSDGNIWEYFFEQLSFPRHFFLRHEQTDKYCDYLITGPNVYELYKTDKKWRKIYNASFKKYIRIKPHIQQKVAEFYSEHMAGKYCIGIHLRSSSHRNEQPNNIIPTFKKYVDKMKNELQSVKGEAVIYLATDVEENVDMLSAAFGDIVIMQPKVKRMTCNASHWNEEMQVKIENSDLKRGKEVLIDCLLLAKCNVFIHVTSNIATSVGYINPEIRMVYCE